MIKKEYRVNKWKVECDKGFRFADFKELPLTMTTWVERFRDGDIKNHKITIGNKFSISPHFDVMKNKDNKYIKLNDTLKLVGFMGDIVEVDKFDEEVKKMAERLDLEPKYYSLKWYSVQISCEYKCDWYLEETEKYYKSYEPYKVVTSKRPYTDEHGRECMEVAAIIDFLDGNVLKVIGHQFYEFTDRSTMFSFEPKEKKYVLTTKYYITIKNKNKNELKKYYYCN